MGVICEKCGSQNIAETDMHRLTIMQLKATMG